MDYVRGSTNASWGILTRLPGTDVARFAYETGTRAGELLGLKWSYLDGDAISVPGSDTKNKEPRSIFITPEVEAILARRQAARLDDCDLIFDREGNEIIDYNQCWRTACVINGLGRWYCRQCRDDQGNFIAPLDAKHNCPRCQAHPEQPKYIGRLFHDFRRSAAYELWRSGATIDDCKETTGHKTDAMFRRYGDLFSKEEKRERQRRAQEKRREYWEAQDTKVLMMRKATRQ